MGSRPVDGPVQEGRCAYFVSMGCHYDNFPLWNSKCHRWNAVNMGPRRDVVAAWQKAAKKYGLPFGVSEHMGSRQSWIQASRGADKKGPWAGVPYDCTDPRFADLYGLRPTDHEKLWRGKFPEWQIEWYRLVAELIDNYHPDLFYTDGPAPFGNEVGLRWIAHLYNSDLRRRGSLGVVYTCKQPSQGRWVEDFERGLMGKINPDPGRPTPRSATGSTIATTSIARQAGWFTCSWTSSARTATCS